MQTEIKNLEEKKEKTNKIRTILLNRQPLYSDLFKYANNLKGQICMISNADIWLKTLDKDLINLIQTNDKLVYTLTRHEHDEKRPLIDRYRMSHDCFIFKSPINSNILDNINFIQNKLGSENVVVCELLKFNYKIYNPCKDIVIIHEHASGIRTYLRGPGESLYYITYAELNFIRQWWQYGKEIGLPPKAWIPPILKKNLFDAFYKTPQKEEIKKPQIQIQKSHSNYPKIRRHQQFTRRRGYFSRRPQRFTQRHRYSSRRPQRFTRRRGHFSRRRRIHQSMQAQMPQKKSYIFGRH